MTASPDLEARSTGTWRELLTGTSAPVVAVLAGGTLLEASSVYVTTSLLPTVVDEIGGAEYYAWTMTSFLVASIVAAMLVTRTLATRGSLQAYLIAFALFAAGSVIAAISASMGVLLVGRAVQGLGGGLLAGLGYVLIRRTLPERLWTRAAALVSAMWGVGNVIGPLAGGLFAQFSAWRGAFLALAALSLGLAVLAIAYLPRTEKSRPLDVVPVASLALLAGAIAVVSLASILPAPVGTALALAAGAGLTLLFLARDRRSRDGVFARATFERGNPLRWVYLTIAILAFGVGTEAFLPRFGQELGGLTPLVAGFFGAALSFGWSVAQVVSASTGQARTQRVLVRLSPVLLGAGLLAFGLTVSPTPTVVQLTGWFVWLFLAGVGIGIGFPFLTVMAMGSAEGDEGNKAAAGVNTVFIIANAFSAALAGVLVNLRGDETDAARTLMIAFAAIAIMGSVFAGRAVRKSRTEGVRPGPALEEAAG